MGSCSSLVGPKDARVLMIGLDASGKTTLLYQLRIGEVVSTIPTIGFNVETLPPIEGLRVTAWDIGGQDKLRPLWRHYYQGSVGILYVVDSTDEERLGESREELRRTLSMEGMEAIPFVVLANKQDRPEALSPQVISERLGLHQDDVVGAGHAWEIHGISAVTGDGLLEAMQALVRTIKKSKRL